MTEKEFRQIVDKYNFDMTMYANSLIGDFGAADVTQESFMELWNKRNEEHENVRAFLFKCVHNKCLNHLKRLKVKQRCEDYLKHTKDISEDYIESRMVKMEYVKRIINEINRSPKERKKVMELFYQGLTPNEIADTLDISASTVSVQIKRFIDNFEDKNYGHVAKLLQYNGKIKTIQEWAKELFMSESTLYRKIRAGVFPQNSIQ